MTDKELLKYSKLLGDFINNELDIPYSFNLIDELNLSPSENAHTRIFMGLLKYEKKGEYVILKSFLNSFVNDSFDGISDKVKRPRFGVLEEYIDGFVEEKGAYSIIIENKINNADDQERQIERYVDLMIDGHEFDKEQVFVIYLTDDGEKEIDAISFTEKAKSNLDYKNKDEPGRFIELSFQYDILPWLRNDVLPMISENEDFLLTGIKQYIDYLEGKFDERKIEEDRRMAIAEKVRELLKLDGLSGYEQIQKIEQIKADLDELYEGLDEAKEEAEKKVMKNFNSVSLEYFDDADGYDDDEYYQLFKKNWPSIVHFEWIPLNYERLNEDVEYTLCLHTEDSCIKLKERLLEDESFCKQFEKLKGMEDVECGESDDKETVFCLSIKSSKPFFKLSAQKQKEFLEKSYSLVKPFFKIIDSYFPPKFTWIPENPNYNHIGKKLKYKSADVYFYVEGLYEKYGIETQDNEVWETLQEDIRKKVSGGKKFECSKGRYWHYVCVDFPKSFVKLSKEEQVETVNNRFSEIEKALSE